MKARDMFLHISEKLNLPRGHVNYPFVDITTDRDTLLFIDPCLIELGTDPLSMSAVQIINDFVDVLYRDMREGRWLHSCVFDEAHEINDTSLGYGNGRNGRGKTSTGLRESLSGLNELTSVIQTISKIQDIPVLIEGFAEDCMSDLLTNVLHLLLSNFTSEQMMKLNVPAAGTHEIKYWDHTTHHWQGMQTKFWTIEGKKVLLVPKHWVRKNYLFKTHQYLTAVVLTRLQREPHYQGASKNPFYKI